MYYIWSLLLSLIIFFIIQYNEYTNKKNKYNIYTIANIATFIMIFMLTTIVFYMLFENNNIINNDVLKVNNDTYVDTNSLKKISENIYTGFNPV